jgi:hypothetical protein
MFVRLSFDGSQKISVDELKKIENTLSDIVDHTQLYRREDGRISSLGWKETDDPKDPKLTEGENKYTLVYKTEFVELNSTKEYLVDIDLFLQKHPNLKIKFRGMPKTVQQDYSSMIESLLGMQEKFERALRAFDKQIEFNQKCDVHVSNLGLLNINQLGYAVDYCTEALQDQLNKGWRIIACCVQPDGRRPDYVMGRYNPDGDNVECIKF